VLGRITSEPSQRAGMFDQFSYGYLGFALGPDGDTLALPDRRSGITRTVAA
jgi:hypothetical protein